VAIGEPEVATAFAVVEVAERLAQRWQCAAAVTCGASGAVLAGAGGLPVLVPATPVTGDACGAGDAFAAELAASLAGGVPLPEAVRAAVDTATCHVAGDAIRPLPARPPAAADSTIDAVRRRGGVVVAAGGCFDVLHAGHVQLLERARALGDCLVVCMNSDRSVRRLKGPGRPVNHEVDRAAVLRGLGCVDAVQIFDEDDPCAVLTRLRPDVFVKGGDYSNVVLPEEATLRAWGGQVVLLPLLPGRSTTRILQLASGELAG
jgi:D-beta-D-heptose 7-phosphate kinase / D-beta-D-heptose 1-phosphate adenosyltransferase